MKKQYDGLEVVLIPIRDGSFMTKSPNCQAMIQLKMENGVCVSPDEFQQIEWVGNKG